MLDTIVSGESRCQISLLVGLGLYTDVKIRRIQNDRPTFAYTWAYAAQNLQKDQHCCCYSFQHFAYQFVRGVGA